jgi:enoyl-CoA hydratase
MELRHLVLEMSADHVATVRLSKPPVNALGQAIREEILRVFDMLHERDDVHVVLLTGQGKVFSAGADIKEKQAMSASPGIYPAANRLIREAFTCIMDCGKPVIAAVNGAAIGAGMVMAACCDIVIAAEDAVFAMPEIDVGLAGGMAFLLHRLPAPKVRRLLLTGDRVSAAEMRRLGFVEECVPAEELMQHALNLARRVSAKSPLALRAIKRSFRTVENLPMHDGIRFEQDMTVTLNRTEDAREAQRAFLEKRTAAFHGR